jgi:hypothetical protein
MEEKEGMFAVGEKVIRFLMKGIVVDCDEFAEMFLVVRQSVCLMRKRDELGI